jgi:predicted small lipoprotein YifL
MFNLEVNEMKKALISVLIVLLILPLIACGQPVGGELLKSDKERITSPDVSTSEQAFHWRWR